MEQIGGMESVHEQIRAEEKQLAANLERLGFEDFDGPDAIVQAASLIVNARG